MADNNKVIIIFGGAGRGQRVMWYLVSFLLLVVGCALCCAGELWAVVLYLPFIISMVCYDISLTNSKAVSDKQKQ